MSGIIYTNPPGSETGLTPITAANDGVSEEIPGTVRLGQAQGAVGNPGQLLDNREIPLNGSSLRISEIGQTAGGNLKLQVSASDLNHTTPQITFLDSAGVDQWELGIDLAQGSFYFGLDAGLGITGFSNFFIGSFVGISGSPAQHNNIFIGNDAADVGAGNTIGNLNIMIGADNFDQAFNIGNENLVFGQFNNNSNGGALGDKNIIIGNENNVTGITNTIIIGFLANLGFVVTLSNVIILGRPDQNTLIGQNPLTGYTDNGNRLQVTGNIFATGGYAGAIRTTATAAETFGVNDLTIIADTTASNINVSVNPAAIGVNRFGYIKKKGTDFNTVTITPTSGSIYGSAGAAASFTFSGPGESIEFQSDGTNLYVL